MQVIEPKRTGFFFVTNRLDHNPYLYKSQKIHVTDNMDILADYLDAKAFGYDIETNGSRFYTTAMLLISIGDRDTQFVIDCTCSLFDKFKEVFNDKAKDKLAIGHNIKFDYTHSKINGIYLPRMFDTFLASQRIYLGRKEIRHNLEDSYERFLREKMDTDKEIRKDFMSMNLKSRFDVKHILYSGTDIKGLIDIARVEREMLRATSQWDWFNEIENGIVDFVGDMEIEGIYCYPDKWQVNLDNRKNKKLTSERTLDEILRTQWNFKIKPRNKGLYVTNDLFGGPAMEVENTNTKHINYSSSKQVLKIIKHVGEPVPINKTNKGTTESVSEKAIQPYLIERPFSPLKPFLKEYLEYKGHEKFISSYGQKFLKEEIIKGKKVKKRERGFVNPVTKKCHTYYKQIGAETGRLSSGNVKEGFFQSQNLPAEKPIRESFGLTEEEISQGWMITTCDLSGAELIIMAALADEQHLYELGADKIINGVKVEGDLHSPIATKCWRAIYDYKVRMGRSLTIVDSYNKEYTLTSNFVIDKQNNKQLRTDFKPMTFGIVYGLRAKKGGQTLNIAPDEAQIAIDIVTREFPKVIKMVETAAMFAVADGFVEFNCVSHNRRWFSEIVSCHDMLGIKDRNKRYAATKEELPFKILSEIESAARNCRIQGTQSDMLKESKLRLRQFAQKNKIEMVPLLSVHDELAIKHKSVAFKDDIEHIMTETANKYLAPYSSNIRMRAEATTKTTWTK